MAENKKSFIAYVDWLEIFEQLPDEKAGQLVKHLFRYVSDKNPTTDDVLINAVFAGMKTVLKRDLEKYRNYTEKQSLNGKKGGRPKKTNESQKTQAFLEKPKKADNVNVNVNDTVNDKKKKKEYIPEFSEFKDYAISNQFNTDIKRLEFKYKSWIEAGWVDGKGNKITNWKSKLLNTLPYLINESMKQEGQKPKLAMK